MSDEAIFRAGSRGGFGVGGCAGWFMLAVFGPLPFALIAFTVNRWHELPVGLTIMYILSFFPLAVLFVISRLMSRYAIAVLAGGTVEIVYPFKTMRLGPGDFSRVVMQAAHLGYAPGGPIHRPDVKFARDDGAVAASVALNAFSPEDWQGFLVVLQRVRPDVRVG